MEHERRRSAPRRLGALLTFGVALLCAPLLLHYPGPVALVALAVAFLERRSLVWFAIASGLALGGVRAHALVDSARERSQSVRSFFPRPARCSGFGTVRGLPSERNDSMMFELEAEPGADCEGANVPISFRALVATERKDVTSGARYEFVIDVALPQTFANFRLEDEDARAARRPHDVSGACLDLSEVPFVRPLSFGARFALWIDDARKKTRAAIHRDYPPTTEALARALVLGENDLDDNEAESFRASGLSHLLAVSGTHLIFAIGFLAKGLERALLFVEPIALRIDTRRVAAVFAIPLAWTYCAFAGGSGSAMRASWMLTAALFARAINANVDGKRSFAWSIALGALVDPLAIYDLSFVLSVAATAGLFLFAPRLAEFSERVLPKWVGTPMAATLGATFACAPFILPIATHQGLLAPIANLVAAPVGEWCALPPSLLHAFTSSFGVHPFALARLASGALFFVRWIALISAKWTVASPPPLLPVQSSMVAIAILSILSKRRAAALAVLGSFAAILISEHEVRRAKGALAIEVLDVGQGDSTLVRFPDGEAMLIDAGGIVGSPTNVGARVVGPVLRASRISRLRLVALSHPHPDHFGGMKAALSGIQVDEFWDTGQGEAEGTGGGFRALLESLRERHVPVRHPEHLCGRHSIGGVVLDVLAPCPSFSSDRSPNDNSFIFRLTFGTTCALLVGDAEQEAEALLLARGSFRCDVLKIGHHGSRTSSSPPFLDALAPTFAVISSGVRNRFGHPHPETLTALASRKIVTARTDTRGATRLTSDGARWTVQTKGGVPSADFGARSVFGWLE